MSFLDLKYYIAFAGLMALLILLQKLLRDRPSVANTVSKSVLLGFSLLVMATYDPRFCLCMAAVIIVTYISAMKTAESSGKTRKVWATSGVIINVLALVFFKYTNFFISSVLSIAGRNWNALNIILPLGISFYILSAISYIIDVDRETTQADSSLLNVALFIGFFPKLTCGPIVHGKDFMPQLRENRWINRAGFQAGIQIFMFGLFKKLVLADHMAVFVEDYYFAPAMFNTATTWLAVFSYFIQLYFDFSGYSDMAIGTAKMLGYEFERNFNLPFMAANISEFWDRWHISLSSWLNSYVFNPLALKIRRILSKLPKERRKKLKNLPNYVAVLLTFLISGLWHGVGYTYIVWGLLHGLLSIFHNVYVNLLKKWRGKTVTAKGHVQRAADILLTFFAVNILEVFYRAHTVGQAFYIISRLFTHHNEVSQISSWALVGYAVLIIATIFAYIRSEREGKKNIEGYYPVQDLSTVKGLTLFLLLCFSTIAFAYFGETFFIYGQF